MLSLTTAQRDILHLLLTTDVPVGAAVLGEELHLTVRQVHYGLRAIESWLARRQATLRNTPGVGVQVVCSRDQQQRILAELSSQSKFQLILTPEQRQQLLAVVLLSATMPLVLNQLQNDLAVARATVLKDLDIVEEWLQRFGLRIARRQHRGCWVDGDEFAARQALAALVWGDVPFDRPILSVQHAQGITFVLSQDANLLPIVGQVKDLLGGWDVATAQELVAWAERELQTRFADDAFMSLALAVALQHQRMRAGQVVALAPETVHWVQTQVAWPVARRIVTRLWPHAPEAVGTAEAVALALHLVCGARDAPWRNDLSADSTPSGLVGSLMQQIAVAYAAPELAHDQLLRDGLEALILPAGVRQRFGLWTPPRNKADIHLEGYAVERSVAAQLADDVAANTGMTLPPDALDDLTLLLRAAVVRAQSERAQRVLVVCPSGMATTQLLVARLKAHFPHLGTFEVLPMRALTADRIARADLIITTVPLSLPNMPQIDVIHVHPMLKPEDIAALTQWMA